MKIATSSATATSDRSPPESSDSRLIFLPGGRASTSMPVVSMLSGSVRTSRPSPPGNSRCEDPLELRRGVLERLGEDPLDALVDLLDDVEQVALGVLEVLELLGEELVPLLEGGELLEGERVDAPERVQLALGLAQPLLLRLAHERDGLGLRRVGVGIGVGHGGTSWCGPNSSTRSAGVDAELLDRLGLELLDAQPLLGAGHLVAVHGVGQLAQLGLQDRDVTPHDGELGVTLGALGLACRTGVPPPARPTRRAARAPTSPRRARRRRPRPRAGDALASPRAAGGSRSSWRAAALERVGAVLEGAGALLAGAQREPQLGLGRRAAVAGHGLEAVALARSTARRRVGPRRSRPRAARASAACSVWSASRAAVASAMAFSVRSTSAARGPQGLPERAELLGDRGHPGVALVAAARARPRPRR